MPRTGKRRQRHYDHRLRELVFRTGDATVATDLGVPRSTAAGWVRGDLGPVVSFDLLDRSSVDLQAEIVKLRRRVETLRALVCLLVRLQRITSARVERTRISDASSRTKLLRAAERAEHALPKRAVLKILGISPARYAGWKRRERGCEAPGQESCIRSTPTRLMAEETSAIRRMATDERYRHVPTSRLSVLAARLGTVFASPTTWYRLVREREWSRPRLRKHPKPPKEGIRASGPDEIWHIDTSTLRLTDGTKVWLHAVVDNFSRRVLAWRVADRFAVESTVSVLEEAAASAVTRDVQPELIADGGIENFNAKVDGLVATGMLRRVRALVDVKFSNSMIESWWSTLKHQWLYLHRLDSVAGVRRHVAFYVTEYNGKIPHAAFRGQTPDEIYYGRGERIPVELEVARGVARARRLAVNRAASCGRCVSKSNVAA
jgi:transposase InsO family protein